MLARLGQRLNEAMAGVGSAYRIGGDEFCVIARGDNAEDVLRRAQEALSEHDEEFTVRCGLGTVAIAPDEMTFEEALRTADQRLYVDKAAARADKAAARADARRDAPELLGRAITEHSVADRAVRSGDDMPPPRLAADVPV